MKKKLKKKKKMNQQNNSDFIHFIYTPFTGLGNPPYRGNNWFVRRISIFKNYTLKSLLNQTNKNFVHWMSFRAEEKDNPLLQMLYLYLSSIKDYKFIMTFGGTAYWDDKYEEDNLLERLRATLPFLGKVMTGKEKYVMMTILASDDMYASDAVEVFQSYGYDEKRLLVFYHGYIYNIKTKQLGTWEPPDMCMPPFYTIFFPTESFLDPDKHYEYTQAYKDHWLVEDLFNTIKIPMRGKYCVTVHGNNISTRWNQRGRGLLRLAQAVSDHSMWKLIPQILKKEWLYPFRAFVNLKIFNRHHFIGKIFWFDSTKKKILKTFGATL